MITTKQAAAELGVSVSRVQQLIRKGLLPAVQLGGVWLIQPRALDKARKRPDGRGRQAIGRPRKLVLCERCGAEGSATEMRRHKCAPTRT